MRKIYAIQLSVSFLLLMGFLLIQNFLPITTEYNNDENRVLAEFPGFVIKDGKISDWSEQTEAFYKDHYFGRSFFIHWHQKLKYNVLGMSPDSRVVRGKQDWFFLRKFEVDPYFKEEPLSEAFLDSLSEEMARRTSWYHRRGIEFYVSIVPSKISMYPEKLPTNLQQMQGGDNGIRAIDRLVENDRVNGINLHPVLAKAKAIDEGVYFKNDNHWTSLGAFSAYQSIMQRMAADFPGTYEVAEYQDFEHKIYLTGGIVRSWCPLDDIPSELYPVSKVPGNDVFKGEEWEYKESEAFSYPHKYEVVLVNPKAPAKKKVMIIRDSFGSELEAFFPMTVYLTNFLWDTWDYRLNPEIVIQENPDVVVLLILEGNLDAVQFADWDTLAVKNTRMDFDHFVRETEHNDALMQQLQANAEGAVDALDKLVFEQSQAEYHRYLTSIGSSPIYGSMQQLDLMLSTDTAWQAYIDSAAVQMKMTVPRARYLVADSINKAFVRRLPSWE